MGTVWLGPLFLGALGPLLPLVEDKVIHRTRHPTGSFFRLHPGAGGGSRL